jgi:hypothetical protein
VQPITKKVAKYYSVWICFWVLVALYGELFTNHGEFGLSAWFWLSISGLPLSFLTWHISANGSLFGIFLVSLTGLIQWCTVTELFAKFDVWRKTKNAKT